MMVSHTARSQPCLKSIRSVTAMNGSIGQLPAPAPCPASDASTRWTPFCTAETEFATESEGFVGVDTGRGLLPEPGRWPRCGAGRGPGQPAGAAHVLVDAAHEGQAASAELSFGSPADPEHYILRVREDRQERAEAHILEM
jgi:hypothetical protein